VKFCDVAPGTLIPPREQLILAHGLGLGVGEPQSLPYRRGHRGDLVGVGGVDLMGIVPDEEADACLWV
jgi:hypothetical protein